MREHNKHNKYRKYSRDELLRLEERLSRELEKHQSHGWRDVDSIREELQLVYDAMNPDKGGTSSPEKCHTVKVEMEIHIAEGTYFPASVEPGEDFKWEIFADTPEDADEVFNECRIYNILDNAVKNIHGLTIGELKVGTSSVDFIDSDEEGV